MSGEAPRYRFPRSSRLLRARDFQRVFRGPRRAGNEAVVVLAKHNGGERPRLGIAVSRKVSRSAVRRNRIKRIIRESFRVNQATLRGLDVVVVARPGVTALDDDALRATLGRHWLAVSRGSRSCAK